MRRLLPVLLLCVLVSGCSVLGPDLSRGDWFWAYAPGDGVGGVLWKTAVNAGLGVFYLVLGLVYIAAHSPSGTIKR